MKTTSAWLLAMFLISALTLQAQARGGGKDGGQESDGGKPANVSRGSRAVNARQPVVIQMGHGTSGGHNRNFPSQKPAVSSSQPQARPSYGTLRGGGTTTVRRTQPSAVFNRREGQPDASVFERPATKSFTSPGHHAAVAVHHHPYTTGYVRKKLQKLGVKASPGLITDRSEIIHTDRLHSAIVFPKTGPGSARLSATVISPRDFNDPLVRRQMAQVNGKDWVDRVHGYDLSENRHDHYYWHSDKGFNYCHFIDGTGYHWWGWYMGDRFFWTRYYSSRWWWYDTDYDRWCFWNDGFWWWQDPYHVGDLYCYNDATYVPCNSANDQVVVTAPSDSNFQATQSPDGSRTVKVVGDSQDAFLYDNANPPTFDPVYLASGVQEVQFSNPSDGRPLEIMLKLNDGSFDMFDSYGTPYNAAPSDSDADQAPADPGTTPPTDDGQVQN